MLLVKSFENTKCEATQENLSKLLNRFNKTEGIIEIALKYDAYFYVKNGILCWGHNTPLNSDFWKSFDTIHLVNGQFYYTKEPVTKEKPKNNFKEYGFEADFEGNILFKQYAYYVGYVVIGGRVYGNSWDVNGKTFNANDKNYNLKPIKKEWYENPDNFPCIIISLKTNKPHIAYNYNHLEEKLKQETFSAKPDKFRPATKEEVLSLLVKED